MMTFKEFKKYMLDLKRYFEYEDALYEVGINIWERKEIGNIITNYVNLIAKSFNLPKTKLYGTELDYFIYEVRGLEDNTDLNIPEPWDSLEHLYEYLVECGRKEHKSNFDIDTDTIDF